MRRLICLAAAFLCLASCFDEQGLIVNPPSQLVGYQWYTNETDDETGEEYICLWDFTAAKGCIYFVYFDNIESLRFIPQYTFHSYYALPYVCHKKGDTWILTVDDGYDTAYYFSDIKAQSAHVSTLDGYANNLTRCNVKVTPVPYD